MNRNETVSEVCDPNQRILPFRAMLQGFPTQENEVFYNKDYWENKFIEWKREGFNAVIWYGPGELTNGSHMWIRHVKFPEARELSESENEKIITQFNWLFDIANRYGLKSLLQTQPIFFTDAFGKAHSLDTLSTISPSVGKWHIEGYPNFWPLKNGKSKIYNCDVRNELTTAYTQAVFEELLQIYPNLYGFMGFNGEPLSGDRSTFFKEAIAPALKNSKRNPLYIANQWQTPLPRFLTNQAPKEIYNNMWLGFHGYNSEQITDTKPYPGTVYWSEQTQLPTVVEIYPANQLYFPFNSPEFAYEIAKEMKLVPGFTGFVYYERYIAGTLLGPLFRKALAYYSSSTEDYSDEPWIQYLYEKYGSREAAIHFLEAYKLSSQIIPEKDALLYCGGDVLRRELRIPYTWFTQDWAWNYMTSPARGGRLVPISHYVQQISKSAISYTQYQDKNGADPSQYPYYQQGIWNSEGGSIYNVTPEAHMRKISQLGRESFEEATMAMDFVKENEAEAHDLLHLMQAYKLLSIYYEIKVMAAIAAMVYKKSPENQDKREVYKLADKALFAYKEFAFYADSVLNPYFKRIAGAPLTEAGIPITELWHLEQKERKSLAEIFDW